MPIEETVDRREFISAVGAGLLITTSASFAQRGRRGPPGARTLGARLHIAEDGIVTVFTGKIEVGQGSRTEITMAAAEELRLPVERIRLVMGDTELTPNDGGTAGSRTTPSTIPAVRRGAAMAREILIDAAGQRWRVDRAGLEVRDGVVTDPATKRRLAYAELARLETPSKAFGSAIPSDVEITRVAEWRVLGTSAKKVDGDRMVTGQHRFPSDTKRPNMLYGAVLRPPSYGASLESVDLGPARKMAGVIAIRETDFTGCAAPTSWRARKAVEAIAETARWKTSDHPSSETLSSYLKQHAVTEGSGSRGPRVREEGSVDDALASAKTVLRASFDVPYIQHAPMEPRAAVAEWANDKLTVWVGTQQPLRVRQQLEEAFGLAPERVRVIVPDTGGGFGGKHSGEVAIEAARLAKAAGRPVSLRWTREEEFAWAYCRPAGVFETRAGLDEQGAIVAWEHTTYNAGASALASPYRIPNRRESFLPSASPLREGSYRALSATTNNFARECFMDELAEAAGADPLAFRLANAEESRLRAVFEAAAERFDWKRRKRSRQPGIGVGLAGGTEKGSYVAACVEVAADRERRTVEVREVCQAFECGAVLHPDNLRAQVEGCILMGLGGAMDEGMRFENGRLLNGRFSRYRVPRFRDVPRMETVLLNRPDLPAVGGSETPIIAVAPAVANAVWDAIGVRVRSLPIRRALEAG